MKVFFNQYWILTIVILLKAATYTFGQEIAINLGVDTTDKEAKTVIAVWTNYLKLKPNKENIKDCPYWAQSQKKKYPKVDQLLNSINTETSTYSMGNATIIYVKPKNDFFEVKTLFGWSDSLHNVYPLCITSIFLKKENGEFKLYNALTVNSHDWQIKKIRSVTFHFQKTHIFDKMKANKLLSSIYVLTKQWNLREI